MASRYWVGGTGNWDNNTANWAATSGGVPGVSVPGTADDVFFDANSGYAVVVAQFSGKTIGSINCTGFRGTLDFSTANGVDLVLSSGDAIFDPGMTYIDAEEAAIEFSGSGTQFFTTNGVPMPFTAGGGRSVGASNTGITKFGSNAQVQSVACFQGIVDFNGFDVQCQYAIFQSNVVSATVEARFGSGTLTVGSTTVTLANPPHVDVGGSFPGNVTITPGTSKIKIINTFDGRASRFNGGGFTFNNVDVGAHIGRLTEIQGSNTFNNFNISGTNLNVQFDAGTTQTATSFTTPQNPANQIGLCNQTGSGPQWGLSVASGLVDVYGCAISNSAASGGATFNAIGKGNANLGNNSGWLFEAAKRLLARSTM